MVEVYKNNDVLWDWISKNVGQVMNVDPNRNCGYQDFIEVVPIQKIQC